MSVRRGIAAAAIAVLIVGCVVGSGVASSDDTSSAWTTGGSGAAASAAHPNRIATDALGDSARGVDIQSLGIFNRNNLDFVGLSVTGRDFRVSTAGSVQVYLDTTRRPGGPNYRVVAMNPRSGAGDPRVRLYRVRGWTTDNQRRVECGRLTVQFDISGESQIRIAIPRSCIGGARGTLGVNASVWGSTAKSWARTPAAGPRTDAVPDVQTLTPTS